MRLRGARFWSICALQIWLTHAFAYLAHEYAHSFTAWLLQCKQNPLALHYGNLSLLNLLGLVQINENVDYAALFAEGRGHEVALIAFAGIGFGNVLFYLLSRHLLHSPKIQSRPWWMLFSLWLCLMNLGNFYDYVPIRAFTPDGDIAHLVQGIPVPPWLVLIILGVPVAWAMWDFLHWLMPHATASLPQRSGAAERYLGSLHIYPIWFLRRDRPLRIRDHLDCRISGRPHPAKTQQPIK